MAEVAYDWLNDVKEFLNEKSDPRTKGLPFMDSPVPLIVLSICYLYFVSKAGPKYMRDRKPYDLKTVIVIYNAFQILCCTYIIYSFLSVGSFGLFQCDNDYTSSPKHYKIAKIIWWTTMLKLTEYIETVFFVLRKKQNQVSGLHLYHHISTLTIGWLTSKFSPGIEAVAPIIINSFIHVLMYSYYSIALIGGREIQKKIVLWKRLLTILQMIQFTVIIVHLLTGYIQSCSGPKVLQHTMLLNIFVNYFMFYRFYKTTYKKVK